ncbi:MAG: c-type cytochrome [Myxococcota bacterium]|jgi:mono/diheme cytochrome c family protein|nr:c-type cytochrome [Myxococcota bacterium]
MSMLKPTRLRALAGGLLVSSICWAVPAAAKIESSPEVLEAGKGVYERRCTFCHGEEGAGDGPVADYLDPRPRDFTIATFKFRSTKTGCLPTDEDLFRTITEGVHGTAMPTWGKGDGALSEEERWQVLHYIKTFDITEAFGNEDFDPTTPECAVSMGTRPVNNGASIAKGDEIFHDTGKGACVKCHGLDGRGDGADNEKGLQDDWGFPIKPRILSEGWRYRRGTTAEDIYFTLRGGLMGTPMPSVADTLSEEETWHLAHYVVSLIDQEDLSGNVVLKVLRAEGGVPTTIDDERWALAPVLHVPLVGQVLVTPRWQNPSVQRTTLRAYFDDENIAIRATWNDRVEDRGTDQPTDPGLRDPDAAPGEVETYFSVERAHARGAENLSDRFLLQFPTKLPDSPEKPHFFMGSPRLSANQWVWSGSTDSGVEQNAKGIDRDPEPQADESQQLIVQSSFENGQWTALFVRPLNTDNTKGDVQFETGRMIPIAVNAWDASSGEWGLQRSISSWYYIELERPVEGNVYAASAVVAALIAGIELLLIRRARTGDSTGELS